ncbi:hypothetical protein [Streptomyces salinarius]|uniref:hypothetical protein n=1 Tax=Streptomyces salinarius TaxID=2762598 RepID=UPI003F44D6B6
MPEYYSSIGEALGAAMQHNIRLAHRSAAPGSDKPLQVAPAQRFRRAVLGPRDDLSPPRGRLTR